MKMKEDAACCSNGARLLGLFLRQWLIFRRPDEDDGWQYPMRMMAGKTVKTVEDI
jgi:hypothetical protein